MSMYKNVGLNIFKCIIYYIKMVSVFTFAKQFPVALKSIRACALV